MLRVLVDKDEDEILRAVSFLYFGLSEKPTSKLDPYMRSHMYIYLNLLWLKLHSHHFLVLVSHTESLAPSMSTFVTNIK